MNAHPQKGIIVCGTTINKSMYRQTMVLHKMHSWVAMPPNYKLSQNNMGNSHQFTIY